MADYHIIWTETAINQLDELYDYLMIEIDGSRYAKDVIENIIDVSKSLSIFPMRYPQSKYHNDETIRCVDVSHHSIFYSIDGKAKEIAILQILNSKRNIRNLLN